MARGIGDPNTQTTALIGVIAAVMLFVVVVALQALFYRVERGEARRKVEAVVQVCSSWSTSDTPHKLQ